MRARSPSSRGSFQVRLSFFNSAWAVVAPILALYLRDATILSWDTLNEIAVYWAISVVISIICFSAFRIHDGMSRYFSVHDAIDVAKAVAVAALLTYAVLFTYTRLEGIPRSIPFVHALILAAGLVSARTLARMRESDRHVVAPQKSSKVENIVMLGSTRLTLIYMKFLEEFSPDQHRIMAILDDRPDRIGRALEGVRVVAPTPHLEIIVNEFKQHGVNVDRVIAGGDSTMFAEAELIELRRIACEHEIRFDFVADLVGLSRLSEPVAESEEAAAPQPAAIKAEENSFSLPPYFWLKRFVDFGAAIILLLVSIPIWLVVGVLALLDVGSPVMFWQQRLGQGGRTFMLHKIRTLRAPFDWQGQPIPEAERLSSVGKFLRAFRLDELPQILNVLVGDMSLIGPRPLLPHDQPHNPTIRLMVRPGITGWAQVNGATLLTPNEKDALDEWYIRNASLWLDLRIVVLTVLFWVRGQQRNETVIADALAIRNASEGQSNCLPSAKQSDVAAENADALGMDASATLLPKMAADGAAGCGSMAADDLQPQQDRHGVDRQVTIHPALA